LFIRIFSFEISAARSNKLLARISCGNSFAAFNENLHKQFSRDHRELAEDVGRVSDTT